MCVGSRIHSETDQRFFFLIPAAFLCVSVVEPFASDTL